MTYLYFGDPDDIEDIEWLTLDSGTFRIDNDHELVFETVGGTCYVLNHDILALFGWLLDVIGRANPTDVNPLYLS